MAKQLTSKPARKMVIDEMSFSLQAAGMFDWALERLLPADAEIELAEFATERQRHEHGCPA